MTTSNTAILIAHGPDRRGLVASITQWLKLHGGNILDLDQHVDRASHHFFIRVEWDLEGFDVSKDDIQATYENDIGRALNLKTYIHFQTDTPRIAIMVSQLGHCFWDILARHRSGEWNVDIPLVISNHETFGEVALQFGSEFHHIPVTPENKQQQEHKQLELLQQYNIDFVVLARYMQILSDDFVSERPNNILNIHHSFLPAFAGAKPYHRAHERGVKVIGATAHYVTSELDEGPIIEQDTVRITHRDSVSDLIRKGRDLEKIVLSRAIYLHLERRIAVHQNRTIVFS